MRGSTSSLQRSVVVISCFTVIVAVAVALDLSPWVRGGFGWRWPYEPLPLGRVTPLALAVLVYVVGAWWLLRRTLRSGPVLAWSALGSVAIALAGTHAHDGDAIYTLFTRTSALLSGGPHWTAAHVNWAAGEWREWSAVTQQLGGHLSNLPPGGPMWYGLLNELLNRAPGLAEGLRDAFLPYQCHNFELLAYSPGQWASALFGVLMPVWAALTVFPLYAIARRVAGPDARHAVLWWALAPGITSFAASWSTLFPLLSTLAFWLLLVGLEKQQGALWFAASGLLTGLALFVNFAFLPLPLLLGLYTLLSVRFTGQGRLRRALVIGLQFGVGLALPWLAFWLAGGPTLVELLRSTLSFHLGLERPYWFWVGMHVWDWVLWTGPGLALLALAGIRRWWVAGRQTPMPTFSVALMFTILILTLSGTARGETGRVWLLFSPFLLVAAFEGLQKLSASNPPSWLALAAAQGILVVALVASLNVMGTDLTPPPPVPQVTVSRPMDATFTLSDSTPLFRLRAWDAEVGHNALTLHLQWESLAHASEVFWFGAVLVGPNGEVVGSEPWQPGVDEPYPTPCWTPGQIVGDEVQLPLPENAAGDWWISLAAYSNKADSEERLPVLQLGQAPDTQIGLGPVTVSQQPLARPLTAPGG